MSEMYSCIFCKNGIEMNASKRHDLDPCAIVLIGHYDRERAEQKEQQFWCHFNCFRKLANEDGVMYIMQPDFATNSENEAERLLDDHDSGQI